MSNRSSVSLKMTFRWTCCFNDIVAAQMRMLFVVHVINTLTVVIGILFVYTYMYILWGPFGHAYSR